MQIDQWFLPGICFNFFSWTTQNVQHEERKKLNTLSTEFTNKNHLLPSYHKTVALVLWQEKL